MRASGLQVFAIDKLAAIVKVFWWPRRYQHAESWSLQCVCSVGAGVFVCEARFIRVLSRTTKRRGSRLYRTSSANARTVVRFAIRTSRLSPCVMMRFTCESRWRITTFGLLILGFGGCAAAPTPSATPDTPLSSTAGDTTYVSVSSPRSCCGLEAIQGVGSSVRDGLSQIRNRLALRFPALEPTASPLLAITDPANLSPDAPPAVQAAAKVKQEEDGALQKVKALRYLATIGCGGCYPDVEEALLAALDDCTEQVRFEAVSAIRKTTGSQCNYCKADACCSSAVKQKLMELAYNKGANCCYEESSARVRRMARLGLQGCQGVVTPADEPTLADPEVPSEGPSSELQSAEDGDPECPPEETPEEEPPLELIPTPAVAGGGE